MNKTYRIFFSKNIIYSVREYQDVPLIMMDRVFENEIKEEVIYDIFISASDENDALEKSKKITGVKEYAFYLSPVVPTPVSLP